MDREEAKAREQERGLEYVLISHTHTHTHHHTDIYTHPHNSLSHTHTHTSHSTHSVRIKQATVADVVLDDADVHVFASCIFGGPYGG